MSDPHLISITVNGVRHETVVEARRSLADVLRHDLGLTGTHIGCEHGICGTCTVLVEGKPTRSCLMFGVQADDLEVETVESLAENGELNALQQAFADAHGLQCGYCTPGFLMLATALLRENPDPNRRRDPRRDVRQPVPLHRLRGDPGGRARRRRRLKPRRSTMATTSAPPKLDPKDVLGLDHLLGDEEIMLRDSVRRWVGDRVLPEIGDWFEEGILPRELAKEVGDLGLLGMHLEGYGCAGASATAYGVACRELEYGDSGLRSLVSVQGSLAMFPIWKFGSEEQKQQWLPGMAAGDLIGCFGLTEPDFGSEPSGMRTKREARRRRLGPQRLQAVDHQRRHRRRRGRVGAARRRHPWLRRSRPTRRASRPRTSTTSCRCARRSAPSSRSTTCGCPPTPCCPRSRACAGRSRA